MTPTQQKAYDALYTKPVTVAAYALRVAASTNGGQFDLSYPAWIESHVTNAEDNENLIKGIRSISKNMYDELAIFCDSCNMEQKEG